MDISGRVGPYFFPGGGFSTIPKTLRIRIRTRLFALLLACDLIPLIAIVDGSRGAFYSPHETAQVLENLRPMIRSEGNIEKIGIVFGDISDYGIPSALLITTARAFLRQRSFIAGSIARIVSNDNPQLARDVEESGRFITLFYTEIDSEKKIIRWVPAGRDQVPIYNPATDSFEELVGKGLPIGVTEDSEYKKSHRKISPGQVIVIGTDRIWESRNENGEIFGKNAFKKIIQTNVKGLAEVIFNVGINEVGNFTSTRGKEDDLTLVVIKIKQ